MAQTKTDPPHVPLRAGGWPSRRAPRWVFAGGAVLLIIAVAVAWAIRPTTAQRASDLRGLMRTMNADMISCAAGVKESLTILRDIETGASHDMATALSEVRYGAANCSPANNELLDNLTSLQAPESLASYHLASAIKALIDWAAPNAIAVQSDVARVLTDRGKPSEAAARAALQAALRKLDAQRAEVYTALGPAIGALHPDAARPALYG